MKVIRNVVVVLFIGVLLKFFAKEKIVNFLKRYLAIQIP